MAHVRASGLNRCLLAITLPRCASPYQLARIGRACVLVARNRIRSALVIALSPCGSLGGSGSLATFGPLRTLGSLWEFGSLSHHGSLALTGPLSHPGSLGSDGPLVPNGSLDYLPFGDGCLYVPCVGFDLFDYLRKLGVVPFRVPHEGHGVIGRVHAIGHAS